MPVTNLDNIHTIQEQLMEPYEQSDVNDDINMFGWTKLHRCAKTGDVDGLRQLVEQGGDLTLVTYDSDLTVAQIAVVYNHLPVVEYIINLEIKGNPPEDKRGLVNPDDNSTIMHTAVSYGNEEMLDYLLERGMDVNAHSNRWNDGLTPLLEASSMLSFSQHEAGIDMSFEDMDLPDDVVVEGRDECEVSGVKGSEEEKMVCRTSIFRKLVDAGADLLARDRRGHTVCNKVASSGNAEMFQLLIERGGYDFRRLRIIDGRISSEASDFQGIGIDPNPVKLQRFYDVERRSEMTSFEWFIMGMIRRTRIKERIKVNEAVIKVNEPVKIELTRALHSFKDEELVFTTSELAAVREALRLGPRTCNITNWEFLDFYRDLMKVNINYREEIQREMHAMNTEHLAVARLCNAHMNKDVFGCIAKYLSYPDSERAEAEAKECDTRRPFVRW